MDDEALRRHIRQTYLNLRWGTALTGYLLPVLLAGLAWMVGGRPLMSSLSAYYHTPAGDVFVGALIAIGSFLFLYKGYSPQENRALNLAGVLAVGVALFPTSTDGEAREALISGTPFAEAESWIHGVSAVCFFLAIAYVCVFRCEDTLRYVADEVARRVWRRRYRAIGTAMVVFPGAAAILANLRQPGDDSVWLLVVEVLAIWVFSTYWLAKTLELSRVEGREPLELAALRGLPAPGCERAPAPGPGDGDEPGARGEPLVPDDD